MRRDGVRDQRSAFVEFYETNKDACLRAIAGSVVDRHLAEELVAEAFARAWDAWPRVSRHPSPAGWVVRTALNTRVSWWRRRRREIPLAAHEPVTSDASRYGLERDVMVALGTLPSRQREVITLRLLLDLDTETTAQVLGIAPGTVTAHLSRAISALRPRFSSTNPDHNVNEVTHL